MKRRLKILPFVAKSRSRASSVRRRSSSARRRVDCRRPPLRTARPGRRRYGVGHDRGFVRVLQRLRHISRRVASGYDVVDYNYAYLPVERSRFPSNVLFPSHARSFSVITPCACTSPALRGIRALDWTNALGAPRRAELAALLAPRRSNTDERGPRERIQPRGPRGTRGPSGVDPSKAVVIPLGSANRGGRCSTDCRRSRRHDLRRVCWNLRLSEGRDILPRIRYGSTTLYQKCSLRSSAQLGLSTAEQVLAFFPRRLWSRIDVRAPFCSRRAARPCFRCSVGVSPAYYKGWVRPAGNAGGSGTSRGLRRTGPAR